MKTLVAYFSAETGRTRKAATLIAKMTGGELFEITPETEYSKADLNWKNPLARCNKEKIGKKDVPVAGKVESFEEYDEVFLGFPIWYYGAPNVVATFVKGYDWSGKKIALFATSGGSDMGKTAEKLTPALNGKGRIAGANRFSSAAGEDELKAWAESVME